MTADPAGQTLMTVGDTDADLIVVETGMVEVGASLQRCAHPRTFWSGKARDASSASSKCSPKRRCG